jgi:hypothetical protein
MGNMLGSLLHHLKEFKNDENLPTSIKLITQQRGEKRYKMEGPKSWQSNNMPKRANRKGNKKKSST